MVREGMTFTRVTDPEALAWEEHHAWQALPVGERLRISMKMSHAVYSFYNRQYEAVGGRERLQRPTDPSQ